MIVNCLTCGRKIRYSPSQNRKYCSHKCYTIAITKYKSKLLKQKCEQCGKTFGRSVYRVNQKGAKYCSLRCSWNAKKGKSRNMSKQLRAAIKKVRGTSLSKDHKRRIAESLRGRKSPWTSKRNRQNLGSKSPFWKGGISTINARIRSREEMILWRKGIFERDSYTCRSCGKKGELNAHHIKPFAEYPNLRTDLDNGITLCVECHKRVHKEEREL